MVRSAVLVCLLLLGCANQDGPFSNDELPEGALVRPSSSDTRVNLHINGTYPGGVTSNPPGLACFAANQSLGCAAIFPSTVKSIELRSTGGPYTLNLVDFGNCSPAPQGACVVTLDKPVVNLEGSFSPPSPILKDAQSRQTFGVGYDNYIRVERAGNAARVYGSQKFFSITLSQDRLYGVGIDGKSYAFVNEQPVFFGGPNTRLISMVAAAYYDYDHPSSIQTLFGIGYDNRLYITHNFIGVVDDDSALRWEPIGSPGARVWAITAGEPKGNRTGLYAIGYDHGAYALLTDGNWEQLGSPSAQFYSLAVGHTGTVYGVALDYRVLRLTPLSTWIPFGDPDRLFFSISAAEFGNALGHDELFGIDLNYQTYVTKEPTFDVVGAASDFWTLFFSGTLYR